jgi:hypothetical protein
MALMSLQDAEVLGRRALNRALLSRQLLLRRLPLPVGDAAEHLVGLQAQAPMPPYYGLWSRLEGFDPHELGRMLTDREAVRLTLMRWTLHLVTVADALRLRPLLQPMIERRLPPSLRMDHAGREELVTAARELLRDRALTARELGAALVERGLGDDATVMGNVANAYVPMVQVPPRGVWGAGGQARYATLQAWTGSQPEGEPSIDELVMRYLRSFGPASAKDMQNWSGLTRLKPVFERLRPQLRTFHDEQGRELFDLPDAPRPHMDVPAPVRLLGEYDNVLLGHADRRRIIPEDFPWRAMLADGRFVNNLLVDGLLRATWWIERDGKRRATLAVRPFRKLSSAEREEVAAEARRMIDFAAADAKTRDVRFEPAVS